MERTPSLLAVLATLPLLTTCAIASISADPSGSAEFHPCAIFYELAGVQLGCCQDIDDLSIGCGDGGDGRG